MATATAIFVLLLMLMTATAALLVLLLMLMTAAATLFVLFLFMLMTAAAIFVLFLMIVAAATTFFVTTGTSLFAHQLHAEDIEQKHCEQGCTSPSKPASRLLVTMCRAANQSVGEPFARQEVINAEAESDGTCNDSCEV